MSMSSPCLNRDPGCVESLQVNQTVGGRQGREGDEQQKQHEQTPCGWGDFHMIGGWCNFYFVILFGCPTPFLYLRNPFIFWQDQLPTIVTKNIN